MTETVSTGVLVLADISGYTKYLAGVELEHSHDILADLIGLVAERLCPPLRLAKLEGDAVFCYADDSESPDADALVAALEDTYRSFTRRRRTVALSSSCACDACRRVPELDLKFCAHRGSFVEHEVAGSRELLGSDVVLAHRLLKNTVAETYGVHGYALLTESCAASGAGSERLKPHTERYEDVGEVCGGVLEFEDPARAEADDAGSVVAREDARLLFEADIAAAPGAVWDAITDPAHGMRWRVGVTDIRERHAAGARGVGTVTHCIHGRTTIEQEIVAWLPPHHLSFRERSPIGLCQWTMSLAPLDDGARAHLEWRIALRGGRRQAVMVRLIGRRVRGILGKNFEELVAYLNANA